MQDELLTTKQVAAIVPQTVNTLNWMRATSTGPRWGRLGRRVVYRREDVEAWIAAAFDGDAR